MKINFDAEKYNSLAINDLYEKLLMLNKNEPLIYFSKKRFHDDEDISNEIARKRLARKAYEAGAVKLHVKSDGSRLHYVAIGLADKTKVDEILLMVRG